MKICCVKKIGANGDNHIKQIRPVSERQISCIFSVEETGFTFSPYTKVKSEWIKILNIIFEIQKLWKDNVEKP